MTWLMMAADAESPIGLAPKKIVTGLVSTAMMIRLSPFTLREVSAIGVADPEWGEIVVACVVLEEGTAPGDAALDAHCLALIARFKRPKRYVYLDALPKNNYGKVLKTELRQMVRK